MRLSSVIRMTPFALFTLGLSCANDPTAIRQTGTVQFSIAAGNNQVGQAGQELPSPISVVATDQNNNPIAGQVVNFVVTSGGGSVYALASQTDQNGIAADIWTVGTVSGVSQTLEVRAVDATGTKHVYGVFTASVIGGPPASIVAAAGDGQSASAGTPVPIRPAVRVLDQYGNPSPGQSVAFSVASGGGNLTGANALSDAQGVATVGNWTLGASPGANTLTATTTALPSSAVTFTATGTTPLNPILALATAPSSSGQSGQLLATQPVIQVETSAGVPLPQAGVVVTVTVTGAGGVLLGTPTGTSDANGQVSFTDLRIGGPVGSYGLNFAASGYASVAAGPIALTAGPAAAVAVSRGDGQTATAGTAVAIAPAVLVTDGYGNPVAGTPVTFSVATGGGSLTGQAATTDPSGIATIGSWTLGPSAGMQSLTATAAGTGLTGNPVTFTATATAPVTQVLAIITSPSSTAQAGVAFSVQPVVQLQNSLGAPIPLGGVNVTAALVGTGALLVGTATVPTDPTGRASFSGLKLAGAVGSYSLSFSASGYTSVNSGPITLTAGAAATVTVSAGNGQSANAGSVVPVAPAILATDGYGNGVSGVAVTFAVASGGGTLTGASTTTSATGVATVGSWTLGAVSGSQSLSATVAGTGLAGNPATFSATALGDVWVDRGAPMNTPVRYAAVGVMNGLMYVAGGQYSTAPVSATEYYNPSTNKWSVRAPMLTPRYGTMYGVINNVLYVAGGNNTSGVQTNILEAYNPSTNTWTTKSPMPVARTFGASAVVNGKLYVAGGASPSLLSSAYAYDPATDTWTQLASLPEVRTDATGAALNGIFYSVGGTTVGASDGKLNAYNPATDSWSVSAPMPVIMFHVTATTFNGQIFVTGGRVPGGSIGVASATVEAYDPGTNSWRIMNPLPTALGGSAVGVINGVMYMAGGQTATATVGNTRMYVP